MTTAERRPHLQPHGPVSSDPASSLSMTMKEIDQVRESHCQSSEVCCCVDLQVISDLKRENFDLKLRVYFCEDRLRRSGSAAAEDDACAANIDLQVEVETLKEHVEKLHKALLKAQ
ncbi:Myomegalin [Merluccius polli]|uniref:Myomegalin n=1 Tax=Merluccius polli TaxID=89951 RepID=A0AA47MMY2_MERPO|nr:Myomegalin [Merluccius polli]